MADLEELAVKRDRGYLVRLVVLLLLGIVAAVFIGSGLTGADAKSCVADVFLGQQKR